MTKNSQNIAIIGGGIMGLSTAHALCRVGFRPDIYDREGFPAKNASFAAGGMLAPYSEIEHMPPAWIEAGLAGIKTWEDIMPFHIFSAGSLLIAHEEDRYILERFRSHLPADKQGLKEVGTLEPSLAGRFDKGIYIEDEAHLNPQDVMVELCRALKEAGCDFIEEMADPEELAQRYDHVIDCRGYAAEMDNPDLRGLKGELAIVQNEEFSLSRPVRLMHPRYPLYIVPREDHVFMIGATIIEGAEDERVSVRSALELLSALYSLHPSFGEAKILEITAGIRPAYRDNLPRIRMNGNVIAANGLFRHGFLLSPVMAGCIADHVIGRTNNIMPLFTGETSDESNHQRRRKELHEAA